jgi:hypothetical protein
MKMEGKRVKTGKGPVRWYKSARDLKKKGGCGERHQNNKKIKRKGIVLIGFLLLLVLIVTASSKTLKVGDDNGAIITHTSTYTETGDLDKRLTSQSEHGVLYTIVRSAVIIALMVLLISFMKVQYRHLLDL